MSKIEQGQHSEDAVANELLDSFVTAWTEVFELPLKGTAVDTINQNTAVIVYFGDGKSNNAKLMREFCIKYDKLMEQVYDGNEYGFDLAIAWSGRLHPDAAPSANAIITLHPDIADRFENTRIAEFWQELGLGIFLMEDDDEGPMGRWHEAARSIMVSDPYVSVPGRKWFAISTNTEVSELLGEIPV